VAESKIPGTYVVEIRFGVEFTCGISERVRERAGRGGLVAERIERVGLRQRSRSVAQRSDRAKPICFVVACRGAAQHRQRFVDISSVSWPCA
jgi:hypothetical protein